MNCPNCGSMKIFIDKDNSKIDEIVYKCLNCEHSFLVEEVDFDTTKGIMKGIKVVAGDTCGVTQISTKGLERFLDRRNTRGITRIEFFIDPNQGMTTRFIDCTGDCYEATGFSWGYRGEGPHGLVKAILSCKFRIREDDIFNWKGREAVLTKSGWEYKI